MPDLIRLSSKSTDRDFFSCGCIHALSRACAGWSRVAARGDGDSFDWMSAVFQEASNLRVVKEASVVLINLINNFI